MLSNPTEPLVSVITCFLNEERFLKETILSVLQQTYAYWELILVDDGSSDGSTAIAQTFAGQYHDKIYYVDHEAHMNKGLSASRNTGIRRARGELIAFLDADDIWLPNKLAQQVSIFAEHPSIGLLLEASLYWFNWEDSHRKNVLIPIGTAANQIYKPSALLSVLYPLGKGAAPCPSAIMVRKSAIENSGYFEESFTKEYALYEDQAFLCKMYLQEEVYVSAQCNNKYRQHRDSIVQTVKSAGHYDKVRKYYLNWFKSFLSENNIQNNTIDHLIKKNLAPLNAPLIFKFKDRLLSRWRQLSNR